MTVDLDKLEALEKAATPGPWKVGDYESTTRQFLTQQGCIIFADDADGDPIQVADCSQWGLANEGDNTAFIAAARNALPELIARLRRLESLHGRHADGCMIFIGPSHLCNCPADKERTDLIERMQRAEAVADGYVAWLDRMGISALPIDECGEAVAAYRAARKP